MVRNLECVGVVTARAVPHHPLAEANVIGAMLLSSAAREQATTMVLVEDFYSPANQTLFAVLRDMHFAGLPVDLLTVTEELRRHRVLDEIGGPEALAKLQSPATMNIPRHCRIIVDHAAWRGLIRLGAEVAKMGWDMSEQPATLVDEIRERLERIDIATDAPPKDLRVLGEYIDDPTIPASEWVVEGLLRVGWRVMLVAEEGVGKSVALRQFAILAAAGLHPFAFTPIPPVRVLVIDLENPVDHVRAVSRPIRDTAAEMVSDYQPGRIAIWHREGGINIRNRADRSALEAAIAHHRPQLVVLGPLYKCYRRDGREGHEEAAEAAQQIFDDLRTRYRFALLLEHHAPKGQHGARTLDPYGSSLWLRWPELGRTLVVNKDESVTIRRFRRDRMGNNWPSSLARAGEGDRFPWVGRWSDGRAPKPEEPALDLGP